MADADTSSNSSKTNEDRSQEGFELTKVTLIELLWKFKNWPE